MISNLGNISSLGINVLNPANTDIVYRMAIVMLIHVTENQVCCIVYTIFVLDSVFCIVCIQLNTILDMAALKPITNPLVYLAM